MSIGTLTIHLQIPGCRSLKEKRSSVKPLLARLHREFNISVAETALNDHWQEAEIVCAMVSNDAGFTRQALENVLKFTEEYFAELYILDHHIQII